MVGAFFAYRRSHRPLALRAGSKDVVYIKNTNTERETGSKLATSGWLWLLHKSWLFEHRDAYVH